MIRTMKEDHGILRAAYSPDMRLFATVGYDPNVRVYSEATGKHIQTYEARLVFCMETGLCGPGGQEFTGILTCTVALLLLSWMGTGGECLLSNTILQ